MSQSTRASSGGGAASGGTSGDSQVVASGGQTSSGGATASASSGSAGRAGSSSSQNANSGGAAGQGGVTASSQNADSSGGAGLGGTKASSLPASSGGGGVTASSSANRDAGAPIRDASPPSDASGVVSFAKQIQPMLNSNCTSCHGSSRQNAGVRLDSYAAVKSNLSKASSAISKGTMPPSGGLKTDMRELFKAWVDQGALDN